MFTPPQRGPTSVSIACILTPQGGDSGPAVALRRSIGAHGSVARNRADNSVGIYLPDPVVQVIGDQHIAGAVEAARRIETVKQEIALADSF